MQPVFVTLGPLRDKPEVIGSLVLAQHAVLERVLERLTQLLRDTSARVVELSTLGVQNRIHAELLRLAMKIGVHGNRSNLDPAPKHIDIASRVRTNREQVTRAISALAKAGLRAKEGSALIVVDVERLARLVHDVRESVCGAASAHRVRPRCSTPT